MARTGMRAFALLALLAVSASTAWAAATTPGDSSVGLAGYDSKDYVIVDGPDPTADTKKVTKAPTPTKVTDELQKAMDDAGIPLWPVKSFSNTSAITLQQSEGTKHASSEGNIQLTATGHGQGEAWVWAKGSVQSGVAVCGKAVANAFTNTCGKGNGVIAISSAAEVCANAVAKVYVDSLVKMSLSDDVTGCANATGIANATVAQFTNAVADAIALATTPCASVASYVRSTAFARALVNVASRSLSRACVTGKGTAYTQGTGIAQGMAYGYAKALTQAMAKACACKNCGCQNPPKYYTDVAFSNAVGSTSSGKYALITAVGNAAALFCKGGSEAASVNAVIDTTVKVYANALTQLNTKANIDLTEGFACSTVVGNGNATAIAQAMGSALAGALSINFQKKCGWAAAALTAEATTSNLANVITQAFAETCAVPREYEQCYFDDKGKRKCVTLVGSTEVTVANVTNAITNSPVARSLGKAFSLLKNKCKCEGNCWCGNGAKCSIWKTCPIFSKTGPTYQLPCTGYDCPTVKASPAPTPKSPAPSDEYGGSAEEDSSAGKEATSIYGANQNPL